jgi:hypothetical protein
MCLCLPLPLSLLLVMVLPAEFLSVFSCLSPLSPPLLGLLGLLGLRLFRAIHSGQCRGNMSSCGRVTYALLAGHPPHYYCCCCCCSLSAQSSLYQIALGVPAAGCCSLSGTALMAR